MQQYFSLVNYIWNEMQQYTAGTQQCNSAPPNFSQTTVAELHGQSFAYTTNARCPRPECNSATVQQCPPETLPDYCCGVAWPGLPDMPPGGEVSHATVQRCSQKLSPDYCCGVASSGLLNIPPSARCPRPECNSATVAPRNFYQTTVAELHYQAYMRYPRWRSLPCNSATVLPETFARLLLRSCIAWIYIYMYILYT